MTDITEQAAYLIHGTSPSISLRVAGHIAQVLVDAGLLAEPSLTVPHRDEVAAAIAQGYEPENPTPNRHDYRAADAVLELMADQPTVDGARPWEHEGHKPVQHRDGKPPWCHECGHTSPTPATPAQQIRDGQHQPAVEPRPARPELRVEWRPKPRTTPDETRIEVSATCRKCGTVTTVGIVARHGARPKFPQSLLKCDCQRTRRTNE